MNPEAQSRLAIDKKLGKKGNWREKELLQILQQLQPTAKRIKWTTTLANLKTAAKAVKAKTKKGSGGEKKRTAHERSGGTDGWN